MVPDLIDQALMPGSDVMIELEKEEDEYESFQRRCSELFLSDDSDEDAHFDEEGEGPVLVADLEEYLRRELQKNTISADEIAAGSKKDEDKDETEG